MSTTEISGDVRTTALAGDAVRAVIGQVMGLVAVTVAFLALGAYIGRDLGGGAAIACFLAGFACLFALNVASSRGRRQLAVTLLFGVGLLLGLGLGPGLAAYASADPAAVWQAAGATAAFVAALGSFGYATRRDLSSWGRTLAWALGGLIVFGIVAIFVSIPGENVIWAVAGLLIFGGYTIRTSTGCAAPARTAHFRSRRASSSTCSTCSCSCCRSSAASATDGRAP